MKTVDSLQVELDEARAVIDTMNEHIKSIACYLMSEKFVKEPTVQTYDIIARFAEMRSAVADTECEGRGAHSDLLLKNGELVPAANVEWTRRDPQRANHWLAMSRS